MTPGESSPGLPEVVVVEGVGPVSDPLNFPTTTASETLLNRAGILAGWSIYETTGSATATVDLYDGTGNGGVFMARISLGNGAVSTQAVGTIPLRFSNGLALVVVSGSVAGSVWVVR